MRGLIVIVGLVAVTVAGCDRPIPVALNAPPPTPYPPQYGATYPPPAQYPPPAGAQYPPPNAAQYSPPPVSPPAQERTIANAKGEEVATVELDTVRFNADGRGSVSVCHKGDRGPMCNVWTFNCNYLPEFAHSNYFPLFMQRQGGPPLTPDQYAELDAMDAVAHKLPAAACRLR